MNEVIIEIQKLKNNIKRMQNPTMYCMYCNSKNIKMVRRGLETDRFKCLNCQKIYGVTLRLL